MGVTIRDLAKAVGVSHTTVSLAFKGDSRISDETRRKVIRQPDTKLAQIATKALIASIESGEPIKLQCCLDPELIVRDSTQLYQGGRPGAH